ncbi:MAG: ATP-dependent RecD-like DNA helicase [Ruminococcaceae bacterium]|nr:ATP-dependent RecD-like DNA helicase [Oscillospiraceae bacterium]
MPKGDSLETIRGVIDNVVYYNDGNDYAVLEIMTENNLIITAVGTVPIPFAGENVILKGSWTYHKEFGKQFAIESHEKTLPKEVEGIYQYLSSRTIKGVGPVTAKKIVDRFGTDTFDVLENHPEWLADIQGITMKKAAAISEAFTEQSGMRDVIMFCKDYMTVADATKVYKKLGSGAVGIIVRNPYILCDGDTGLSFHQADEIAASMGFAPDSNFRILSGIRYVLEYNSVTNGHTCLPIEKLTEAASEVLGIEKDMLRTKIVNFVKIGELSSYTDDGQQLIMTTDVFDSEDYIARRLLLLDDAAPKFSVADVSSLIDNVEARSGIAYERLQRKAICETLQNGVTVITGGPGTGKTTIIKALLAIFNGLSQRVVLAAPTGRAAKRMSEATSHEAKTIHRMLEMEKGTDVKVRFGRNGGNPLEEDVCIIDEASMIDLSLMQALVRALRRGARLVLIGDSNQLPSVGAGNILADVIASERISTVALTEIFRQSKESLIVTNAHKINNGEMPELRSVNGDFFFVKRDYERDIPATVSSLIMERLPKTYGARISERIQVITPSKKGQGGVEILNAELQSKMNPSSRHKAEKSAHGTLFRVGDRVMQTVNNYDIEWRRGSSDGMGIFNGDIGVIEAIDNEDSVMRIRFDDRVARYGFETLDELELAYAITVHKSQGSEYPVVIIPMYSCAPMLMTRNLLYTAITRAKGMVIMVGRADIVGKMVTNNSEILRYTTLKSRLIDYK